MPDFLKMLQQAQAMQGRLQEIQADLEKRTVTASSGGGMVTATADGKGQLRAIKIDPSVVGAGADVELLEDLVLAAMSEVQRKAAAEAQVEMQKMAGGLPLPFKLPL